MGKKKITVAFFVVVIIGSAFVGAAMAAFDFDDTLRKVAFVSWLLLVAAASMVINIMWYRKFAKKIAGLNAILTEARDPDRYITEIEAILRETKAPQIRAALLLNLGAAYCDKGEYRAAQNLLMQVNPKKLGGINRAIYWADLAYTCFYLREDERALAILKKNEKEFTRLRNHTQIGGIFAVLEIFQALAAEDRAAAESLIGQHRALLSDGRYADDLIHLQERCAEL